MKIAGPCDSRRQLTLFDKDRRIPSIGSARYHIGTYAANWVAELTGAIVLQTTNSADICPDLLLPSGKYAECKASGDGNQVILYQKRCRRYDQFIRLGNELVYVVVDHNVKCKELQFESDLSKLKSRCRRILAVEAARLHRFVYQKPARRVNGTRFDPRYHTGWTVRLNELVLLGDVVAEADSESELRPTITNQEIL